MSTVKATFTRNAPEDVAFTVEQKEGAKLKSIHVNGKKINKTGNYTTSSEGVKFESSYLESLENGQNVIEFIMDDGSKSDATISIEE